MSRAPWRPSRFCSGQPEVSVVAFLLKAAGLQSDSSPFL